MLQQIVFMYMHLSLLAVCIIETKPVKQVSQEKSQWQRSADQGRTVNYTVESNVLEASNYKDWFHNLLFLEESHASLQLKQMRYFVILIHHHTSLPHGVFSEHLY